MNRFIKYFFLAVFLCAVLLIVFLQYNSNRNINRLINGNEQLLGELNTQNELQQLQTALATLENRVRGVVITGKPADSAGLNHETEVVHAALNNLQSLRADSMINPMLNTLGQLVTRKVDFSKQVLWEYTRRGKAAAEQLVNIHNNAWLNDSIKQTAGSIAQLHEQTVTTLIREADRSGRRARTSGTVLAVTAAIAALFSFGYITYKYRQQQLLVLQLNESEKKVRMAAQAKENFLANMSHEIRTPLNAILGFTHLLQQKSLDAESAGHVKTIQRSGESLLTIINDILDLSKIEAGMMRIEPIPFSLRGLVHSVETLFRPRVQEKQLHLYTWVDEALPDTLEGDALRLTQILVNLLGNAVKFTQQGNISLHFTCESMNGNQVNTGITVTDEGIGIPPEKIGHIFERFRQAEESVTRKFGGTGLGLAIVYDLVQLQNGHITVNSTPGKGTTFKLVIPYIISAEQFTLPEKEQPEPGQMPFSRARILVVEDNEMNRSLLKHLLQKWNLEHDMAGNGFEALDLLRRQQYTLVLMDIQMPEMDGYTAALHIRQQLKLSVPIVAVTAHVLAGEREKCLGYGMNEYLSKPIHEEQLLKLLNRYASTTNRQPEPLAGTENASAYTYIDLQYIQTIAQGNTGYQRSVTETFLETLPLGLQEIQTAWTEKNHARIQAIAHDLKSTVSVFGLEERLYTHLNALEYETLTEEAFNRHFSALNQTAQPALAEAGRFLATL